MQIIKDNWGIIFTSIISIFYLYLTGNFIINLDEFNSLKLNEKGDVLAGIFSPLAFLWLVYGYLQQGHGLKQNTESLRLQAIELKNSVDEQKKLIKIHEEDQKVRFEQAKPILVFDNLHFNPEESQMIQDPFTSEPFYEPKQQDVCFHLKNLGAPIKNVHCFRNGNLINNINLLEKNSKEFTVIFLTTEEEQALLENSHLEIQFSLKYTDMLGLEHTQLYSIRLNDRQEDDSGMYYYACHLEQIDLS